MGDDKKLRLIGHTAHVVGIAVHVCLVECGLDLVHHAEGCGPHLQDREIQRDRHKGHLPAGEQADGRDRLAGRLDLDLDAAGEHVVLVLQLQRGLAAAEQFAEGGAEGVVNGMEAVEKDALHLAGNVPDDTKQLAFCLLYVIALRRKKLIALAHPLILLDGTQIRCAQRGDLAAQIGDQAVFLRHRLDRLPQGTGLGKGQLVVVPQLVQDLLFLHVGGKLFLLDFGALPLKSNDLGVALLRLFFGAGALALQLQPSGCDLCDLGADRRDLLFDRLALFFLFGELFVHRRDLLFALLRGVTTLLAVASQGVQQGRELRDGIFRRSPFRLARGARAALLGLLGQSAVQLESHIGEICLCSLQLRSAAAQLFRRRVAALAQPFQFIGA